MWSGVRGVREKEHQWEYQANVQLTQSGKTLQHRHDSQAVEMDSSSHQSLLALSLDDCEPSIYTEGHGRRGKSFEKGAYGELIKGISPWTGKCRGIGPIFRQ